MTEKKRIERRVWRVRGGPNTLTEGQFVIETPLGAEPFYWNPSNQLGWSLSGIPMFNRALQAVEPEVAATVLFAAGMPDGAAYFKPNLWAAPPHKLALSMIERLQALQNLAKGYGQHTLTIKDLAVLSQADLMACFGGDSLPQEARQRINEHLEVLYAVAGNMTKWIDEHFGLG